MTEEITTTEIKMVKFEWVCKECGKVITSLYKSQIDFLINQHQYSHHRKKLSEDA